MKFPQPTKDDVQTVYREETDKPLPGTLNPHTRYAFFSTVARGGNRSSNPAGTSISGA